MTRTIPGVMIQFLERATVGVASTRTRDLVPQVHFLSGWCVEPDREIAVALIADGFTLGLVEALEHNGLFAMTAEVIGPHETYQFKGSVVGVRPPVDADLPIHLACRGRFFDAVSEHYRGQFADAAILARIGPPALAVRFRVGEIYVQTPGPAAGRRIFPQAPE